MQSTPFSPHVEVALALLEVSGTGVGLPCPKYSAVRLLNPAHVSQVSPLNSGVGSVCLSNSMFAYCSRNVNALHEALNP
jgi:hypothetical protein